MIWLSFDVIFKSAVSKTEIVTNDDIDWESINCREKKKEISNSSCKNDTSNQTFTVELLCIEMISAFDIASHDDDLNDIELHNSFRLFEILSR